MVWERYCNASPKPEFFLFSLFIFSFISQLIWVRLGSNSHRWFSIQKQVNWCTIDPFSLKFCISQHSYPVPLKHNRSKNMKRGNPIQTNASIMIIKIDFPSFLQGIRWRKRQKYFDKKLTWGASACVSHPFSGQVSPLTSPSVIFTVKCSLMQPLQYTCPQLLNRMQSRPNLSSKHTPHLDLHKCIFTHLHIFTYCHLFA